MVVPTIDVPTIPPYDACVMLPGAAGIIHYIDVLARYLVEFPDDETIGGFNYPSGEYAAFSNRMATLIADTASNARPGVRVEWLGWAAGVVWANRSRSAQVFAIIQEYQGSRLHNTHRPVGDSLHSCTWTVA